MRVRSMPIAALLAVLVAGCWGGGDDSDAFDPLPKDDGPVATLAKPRDPAAVEDATRRIDPCVLLNTARDQIEGDRLDEATLTHHEYAFACTIAAKRFGSTWASVRVGEDLLLGKGAKRTSMAGALAYTDLVVGSDCFTELPIEPGQAIAVGAHAPVPRAQRCDLAADLARAVARVLRANPDSSIGTPRLPWSRCELLRRAVPTSLRDLPVVSDLDLGGCSVRRRVQGVDHYPAGLNVDDVVVGTGQRLSIDGRAVYRSREAGVCTYEWEDSRVAPTQLRSGVSVSHSDCEEAEQMVRRTLRTLRTEPPSDAPQQSPLTYPADQAGVGDDSCGAVPFDGAADCAPDTTVEVPGDPVDLIRDAEADPDVSCAMARDAVVGHFDDRLVPVPAAPSPTPYGPGCAFSDPANTVQVWIDASTDPVDDGSGADAERTIDGHPVTLTTGSGRVSLAVAYDTLGEPGQLIGTVQLPAGSPALDERTEALEDLMTDLTETHL